VISFFLKSQMLKIIILNLFCSLLAPVNASSNEMGLIKIRDDAGRLIELAEPVQRVISLSPHITELIYAAGGGEKMIAAVDFSNYPVEAKALPRVGSGYQLDIEAIVGLKPDLIIAWSSGNSREQLERLESLGFAVYYSEPEVLSDIAKNIRDIGKLLGSPSKANQKADDFMLGIERLKKKYKHTKKVTVFYQVWNQPIFTVNRQHVISHIIDLCGGENIFKELNVLSPQVDIESIIKRNPSVIIAGVDEGRAGWLSEWSSWPNIDAVKNQRVYGINADLIVRHTPRILQGASQMCEFLEKAR